MKRIQSKVQIHFEGDIAENHEIPVRTLGKCLVHIQTAFDRAYLDLKYRNGVYKYARMSTEDYIQNELYVDVPKEGGYIARLFSRNRKAKKTSDRVSGAINQVLNEATAINTPAVSLVKNRKIQVAKKIVAPVSYSDFSSIDDPEVVRDYGDRSISKEINEVLSIIRARYAGDSSLELQITGNSTKIFDFNKEKAKRFHSVVSQKTIGKPVIYTGSIKSLDKGNKTGKFINSVNNSTSILRITNEYDFLSVHPYLGDIGEISFIGCPLIEFGSLEPNSGDIYFVCLYSDYKNNPGNIKIQ